MAIVCLIGQGIAYSASPAMQRAAFAALGLDHRYELADVTAGELPAAVEGLRADGVLGANVTVPHKAAVLPLLDEADELATRADAVNTIVVRDRRLAGSNTDIPALVDEIGRLGVPSRAIVLGAGGAARAVGLALEVGGVSDLTYVSRSGAEGAVRWDRLPELLSQGGLLVNATPVGTGSDESPVPADLLHPGLAVLDLVYRPSPTRLVLEARACGAVARGGAGVLLGQGWRSLEAWLGGSVGANVRAAMAEALRRELGAAADV
jgi:shikimate dehydrogenase